MSQPYLLTGVVVARVEPFAIVETAAGLFSIDDTSQTLRPVSPVQINLARPEDKPTVGALWNVIQDGPFCVLSRGQERHVLKVPDGVSLLSQVRITVRPVEMYVPRGALLGIDEFPEDEFGVPPPGPGLEKLIGLQETTIFSKFRNQNNG